MIGEYNYDACNEFEDVVQDCSKKESELARLKEAQKNNMEYMELAQRVEELEKEIDAVEREQDCVRNDKSEMRTMHDTNKSRHESVREEIEVVQAELKKLQMEDNVVYAKAVEDYDKFIANGKTGAGGTLKDRGSSERALTEAGNNLRGGQAAYNATRTAANQLPMTDRSVAAYQERKSRIFR